MILQGYLFLALTTRLKRTETFLAFCLTEILSVNFFMALDGDIVLSRRQGFYKCYGNLLSKISQINFAEVEVASGGYLKLMSFIIFQTNCGSLYCSRSYGSCNSKLAPPADGTNCGPRHVCRLHLHTIAY